MKKALLISLMALSGVCLAQDATTEFHGAGWVQVSRIVHSSDTVTDQQNDFNDNWYQNGGGVISASTKISENWSGSLGVGVIQVHLSRGNISNAGIWYPFWVPFVSEAKVAYSTPLSANGNFGLSLGSFGYNYNPDIKNLGLYLLKGYAYPGTLVSGFGSVVGAVASLKFGGFRNDLILNSETDDKPLYDFSLANIVSWSVAPGLEIGGGVNFSRLLPQNSKVTSPGKDCRSNDLGTYNQQPPVCFYVDTLSFDTATGIAQLDTVTGSMAGTKLMARFRMDPKAWFGAGPLGKDDLVLYGELGVLGLKNYSKYFDDIKRRMPVVVGLNLPGFGILNMSVEVEYYASKNMSDNGLAQVGSWVPREVPNVPVVDTLGNIVGSQNLINTARDDWKWSVNASKVFLGNVQISGQVANDHTRPGGFHDKGTGAEAMTTPKDWYWMFKMAYFF